MCDMSVGVSVWMSTVCVCKDCWGGVWDGVWCGEGISTKRCVSGVMSVPSVVFEVFFCTCVCV